MEFAAHTYIRIEHNAASLCVDVGPRASVLAATALINTYSTALRDATPSPAEADDAGSRLQSAKIGRAWSVESLFASVEIHCDKTSHKLCSLRQPQHTAVARGVVSRRGPLIKTDRCDQKEKRGGRSGRLRGVGDGSVGEGHDCAGKEDVGAVVAECGERGACAENRRCHRT
ncbi:hypothetical protein RR46_08257 [Papilio xuthus]|uniref:Uncharacterized protein n=1 Tax=Papilio xuthus TaxID=66420 RepID=A0A194PEP5_PAPXU|nr:hypothetical protein RR46_08257 [Papilio xuthus]